MKKAKVEVWLTNIENGKLESNNEIVLDKIVNFEATDVYQLRRNLSIPHQSITSALSRLEDEGVIVANGIVRHNDIPYTRYVFVSEPNRRNHHKLVRKTEKSKTWIRRFSEFADVLPADLVQKIKEYEQGNI